MMTHLTEHWVVPWLSILADWSIRWGLVNGAPAAWLAFPPRRAATRHLLCVAAIVAGVLLPVAPRWGRAVLPWPSPGAPPIVQPPQAASDAPDRPGTIADRGAIEPPQPVRVGEDLPPPEPAIMTIRPLPAQPAASPPGAWQIAALATALAWAAVVLVLLARLAGAWLTLSRLKREAGRTNREFDPRLDECRAALDLSRPVRLAVHPLVAHDGKYGQWRTWADGVLPPTRTKPGEVLHDVELRLTRPATVRGGVVDREGRPVAGREVRARAADRRENRYSEPAVKTGADGTYELKFIRPGEQAIQATRLLFEPSRTPDGISHTLALAAGETRDGVDFRLSRDDPGH